MDDFELVYREDVFFYPFGVPPLDSVQTWLVERVEVSAQASKVRISVRSMELAPNGGTAEGAG